MNLHTIQKSISKIISHPMLVLTLACVIIILLFLIKLHKIKLTVRLISHIGIALAIATILKLLRIARLPNGGSVTLGAMVPIILLALIYGPEVGFLTGFLYGMISLILGPYILHPIQVLFDYPFPYMALGLAGYVKNNKIIATILGIFGRFICHFIAGVIFWGSAAPGSMSPYLYSFIHNGAFLAVNGIICLVIIHLLPIHNLALILNKNTQNNIT